MRVESGTTAPRRKRRRPLAGRPDEAESTRSSLFSAEQEEDLTYGQRVIVIARWVLVAGALLFALWNPGSIETLRVQIGFILVLAAGNFYLHARLLKGDRIWGEVVLVTSLIDITAISVMIWISPDGFDSNVFVFYFPAILAFAVAFPTVVALSLAGGVIAVYSAIGFSSAYLADQVMLTRLLMLAGVAVCATMYWRIERRRRHDAASAHSELLAQLHDRVPLDAAARPNPAADAERS